VKPRQIRKKKNEAKILFTNQRPAAERGPGLFEGPSSYPQLCWWSLILCLLKLRLNIKTK